MGSATSASKRHADQPLATTSVKIERDRLAVFAEIAAANRRSVSQELRWLIDQHIAANDLKAAA